MLLSLVLPLELLLLDVLNVSLTQIKQLWGLLLLFAMLLPLDIILMVYKLLLAQEPAINALELLLVLMLIAQL